MLIIFVVAILSVVAFFLFEILNRQKTKAGVKGWVKDQDLDGQGGTYYVNQQFGIGCKPDLLQKNRVTEYKSSQPPNKPYPSDILQLTAEMIATGAHEGELRYANGKSFFFMVNDPAIIDATKKVLQIAGEMRQHRANKTFPEAKPTAKKCFSCVFSKECSFSMA